MTTGQAPLKFHLSLNTTDLDGAVRFYQALFGVEPAKSHHDYAKFEVDEPPLILSLAPRGGGIVTGIDRLALKLDAAAVERARDRLTTAGITVESHGENLTARDGDGNRWLITAGDAVWPGTAACETVPGGNTAQPGEPVRVWEHHVTQPPAERLDEPDGVVAEARLTGTFNAPLDEATRERLVREAYRILRPGGRVVVHGLAGDRPLPGALPQLPGLAALVARVPTQTEPVEALRRAGFIGLQFMKYTEKPWFTVDGVGLREIKLIGRKPDGGTDIPDQLPVEVMYPGPLASATVDGGLVLPRGRRVSVPGTAARRLREGPLADQLHFFDPAGPCETS